MKYSFLFLNVISIVILISCGEPSKKEEHTTKEETMDKETVSSKDNTATMNSIDEKRDNIEKQVESIQAVELSTKDLRAKISQKWSKIHFYAAEGKVIRVKTYPHEGISKRTEEFYFDNGNLMLALIEDNGEGERGKNEEEIDKMYYYSGGEFIGEKNRSEEKEYAIHKSEAEELMQEAVEYLDIYSGKK